MNVLADFVKNTLLKQASFDLHQLSAIYLKKKKIYIYFVFFEIFYIHFVFFIAQNGEVSLGFPAGDFFLGWEGCAVFGDFWAIRPRVCGDSAFSGDILAGKLGEKKLHFKQWLSVFICLFIYSLLFFWLALIRPIRVC